MVIYALELLSGGQREAKTGVGFVMVVLGRNCTIEKSDKGLLEALMDIGKLLELLFNLCAKSSFMPHISIALSLLLLVINANKYYKTLDSISSNYSSFD